MFPEFFLSDRVEGLRLSRSLLMETSKEKKQFYSFSNSPSCCMRVYTHRNPPNNLTTVCVGFNNVALDTPIAIALHQLLMKQNGYSSCVQFPTAGLTLLWQWKMQTLGDNIVGWIKGWWGFSPLCFRMQSFQDGNRNVTTRVYENEAGRDEEGKEIDKYVLTSILFPFSIYIR